MSSRQEDYAPYEPEDAKAQLEAVSRLLERGSRVVDLGVQTVGVVAALGAVGDMVDLVDQRGGEHLGFHGGSRSEVQTIAPHVTIESVSEHAGELVVPKPIWVFSRRTITGRELEVFAHMPAIDTPGALDRSDEHISVGDARERLVG